MLTPPLAAAPMHRRGARITPGARAGSRPCRTERLRAPLAVLAHMCIPCARPLPPARLRSNVRALARATMTRQMTRTGDTSTVHLRDSRIRCHPRHPSRSVTPTRQCLLSSERRRPSTFARQVHLPIMLGRHSVPRRHKPHCRPHHHRCATPTILRPLSRSHPCHRRTTTLPRHPLLRRRTRPRSRPEIRHP